MAVVHKLMLIGCISIMAIQQVKGGCRSCEFTKKDSECKDIYRPKNEHMACVPNQKTKKDLCKVYDKGYKILCMWGESVVTCMEPCPSAAPRSTQDIAVVCALTVSALIYLQRHLQ